MIMTWIRLPQVYGRRDEKKRKRIERERELIRDVMRKEKRTIMWLKNFIKK